jgi:multisubunit Na+/H+ antiporter MnhB subunit
VVFIPIVGGIMQLLIPAAAVVLGFLGRKKEPAAKGMWLTGMILGFVGIAIGLLSIILWSVAFASVPYYSY